MIGLSLIANRRVPVAVALFEERHGVRAVHQRLRQSYDAVLAQERGGAHG